MGSSNPIKKIAKPISKIIPKEIRPALPFILPFVPVVGPALSKMTTFSSLGKLAPLVSKGLMSAGTKAITDPEANIRDILRTGVVSVAPDVLYQGLGSLEQAGKLPEFMTKVGKGKDAVSAVQKIQSTLKPESLLGKAGLITAQTGVAEAPKLARLQREEIEKYNQQLQDQGIRDKAARRKSIFDIYVGAGYDSEYVNSVLDEYGYAEGGRVEGIMSVSPELMKGMSLRDLADLAKRIKDAEEDKKRESKRQGGRVGFKLGGGEFSLISALLDRINPDTGEKYTPEEAEEVVSGMRGVDTSDIMQGIQGIQSGFETAMGEPIFGQRPQPMGIIPGFGNLPRMADGGLMNLRAGGMPAEMDMRGGGFIPIGRKERADDVPARLSKNEFVMTADAVRGAGGGSIEKGAKRMYQTMKRLEAKS